MAVIGDTEAFFLAVQATHSRALLMEILRGKIMDKGLEIKWRQAAAEFRNIACSFEAYQMGMFFIEILEVFRCICRACVMCYDKRRYKATVLEPVK